jgi:hypothetical protein
MPEQFIPLAAAESASPPAGQTAFRLKVLPQAQAATASPRPSFSPTTHSQAGGQPKTPAKPKVTVQHEGERVSRIQIQCSCGQTIELACDY